MTNVKIVGDRYQIIKRIGRGGMGAVYLAHDRLVGKPVALKTVTVPSKKFIVTSQVLGSGPQDSRLALATEFRTLASLRHPNIINVLDYGFDVSGRPFFTMDYLRETWSIAEACEGEPLARKVKLLMSLLQALAYLHRRNIIHRDVKPNNVLVTPTSMVKVIDFGMALKQTLSASDWYETEARALAYMAPELFIDETATVQSDLYAVGVIAYEIFAGNYPFDMSNLARLTVSIQNDMPDLSRLDDDLGQVIGRLVAKQPGDRYDSAEDVIRAICQATGQPLPQETIAVRESYLQASRFVGRHAELDTLKRALNQAFEGRGSAWLVAGESGVGKSRLLDELRIRALVKGALVVRGHSLAQGGVPYQSWREPLRRLVLSTELDDVDAGILRELVPNISTLLDRDIPDVPAMEGAAGQQRLIGVLTSMFNRQTQPLVVILENLHWAEESLEFLKRIVAILKDLPILVVGDFRDDEKPDLPDELPGMQVMKLPRLPAEAITELSVFMLGEAGRDLDLIDFLQRETEGNTFFMVEIVRALAEEAGRLSSVGTMPLPSHVFTGGIEQIIQRRLERVPAAAQELLNLAAVAGRHLDLQVLEATDSGIDVDEWLITCANSAVLEVQDGQWSFAHDKLRERILTTLDDEEYVALSRRVAEAIEAVYPNHEAYALTLFEHWRAASDVEKQHSCLLPAATQLIDIIAAYDRARTYIETGLEQLDEDAVEERLKLIQLLGDIEQRVGDQTQAESHYNTSLALAQKVGNTRTSVDIMTDLGMSAWKQGMYSRARTLAEEGLALAGEINDQKNVARNLNNLGIVAQLQGNYEEAQKYYEQQLGIWREINDRQGMGNTLNNLGIISVHQGDFLTGLRYYEESLDIRLNMGDRWGIAGTLNNLGFLEKTRGNYTAAQEYLEQSLRIWREIGARNVSATSLSELARVLILQGKHTAARDALQEGLQTAHTIKSIPDLLDVLTAIVHYYIAHEEYVQAAELLGMISLHPAKTHEIHDELDSLRPQLEEMLTTEELEAAIERGKKRNLTTIVNELLTLFA